jgi:hypothetical protein
MHIAYSCTEPQLASFILKGEASLCVSPFDDIVAHWPESLGPSPITGPRHCINDVCILAVPFVLCMTDIILQPFPLLPPFENSLPPIASRHDT